MTREFPLQMVRLRDGRRLAFSTWGTSSGRPLLFFHGLPGSRLSASLGEIVANRVGARIISPDRPGFGWSSPKPGRTLLDWPSDMVELIDPLGFDQVGIVGLSAGAPYVAACALLIPERIKFAAIVSGMGPLQTPAMPREMEGLNRRLMTFWQRFPQLSRVTLHLLGRLSRTCPRAVIQLMMTGFSAPDRAILRRPEIRAIFARDLAESFRQGTSGVENEIGLLLGPWGFELRQVQVEIGLWHGEKDITVPLALARKVAESLSRCHPRFLPGEGHLLIVDHLEGILKELC